MIRKTKQKTKILPFEALAIWYLIISLVLYYSNRFRRRDKVLIRDKTEFIRIFSFKIKINVEFFIVKIFTNLKRFEI